jgi:hypothetical protein
MKNTHFLNIFTFIALFLSVILRGYAQQPDTLNDDSTPEINIPQKGIENVWRSSDLDGEQAVLRSQRKPKRIDGSALLPEGSERVGCICMDYSVQKRMGQGACNGHNGVRFWLYQLPAGDTVKIPTLRHEANPDTLTDVALMQLAAYKRYERLMTQKQLDFFKTLEEHPDWANPNFAVSPQRFMNMDTSLFSSPSIKPNSIYTAPMPLDDTAANSVLYTLSALLGSGALVVLKKVFKPNDAALPYPDAPNIPELPEPDDTPEHLI